MRQLFLNVALWSIALCLLVRGQDSVLPAPTLVELVVEAGHSSQIKSLWLDKDETRLVSSSDDRIVIWDFKNRRELRAIKDASLAGVAADSSTLMTQSGGAYELWELKSGNKIFSVKDEKECAFQLVGSNATHRRRLFARAGRRTGDRPESL